MTNNDYLLLIDGSSLLTTQFYGNLPRQIMFAKTLEEKEQYFDKIMQTKDGMYTNAVFGFVRFLLKILEEQKPAYLAVAWDVSRNTFRRKMYADYKANRSETLMPLKDQFMICQFLLHKCGIAQFMSEEFEADDFCGSVAAKFEKQLPVFIMTKDNDYLQLINEYTHLWLMHSSADKTDELYKKYGIDKKKVNAPDRCFVYDTELVKKEFGINAENVNSYKGIAGDTSDNIKGVTGVGEKTATALIAYYNTVSRLYNDIDVKSEDELKNFFKTELGIVRSPIKYLKEGREDAFLSEELATIKRDIDLSYLDLNDMKAEINLNELKKMLSVLEFSSIKTNDSIPNKDSVNDSNRFGFTEAINDNLFNNDAMNIYNALEEKMTDVKSEPVIVKKPYIVSEINDLNEIEELFIELSKTKEELIAFDLETDGSETTALNITVNEEKGYKIPVFMFITADLLGDRLKELINKRTDVNFACFNLKEAYALIGSQTRPNLFCVTIASYLIDPSFGEYDKASIVKREFNEDSIAEGYSSYYAYILFKKYVKELQDTGAYKLYTQIELPLIETLYEMEKRGIMADRKALSDYSLELRSYIEVLEREIYELAGEEFNINSPKQLGVILFEKLELPTGKKTKSGYSTSADVLEKLAPDYEIVRKILEYRQYSKLKSTYADGLAAFIMEDNRIHCKFHQTITATGRLSCTDPNLQNVPVRTELGRRLRKAFVPKEGYVFLDADYSQIELRILAAMSGDEVLINAFKTGADIHRTTASLVFDVPFEQVTKEQRRNAKAVNFGIVYGISAFGLAEDIGISRHEAGEFIDKYFKTYPKVKEYVDGLVNEAKDKGYVSTMFGRRRYIHELDSTNFMTRQFGERVAMNSPVQGTAADIIKIAMIKVNDRLKIETPDSKLLLQIHDELLVETKKEDIEKVSKIIQEEMENAASLSVPLLAEVCEGKDWYEAK